MASGNRLTLNEVLDLQWEPTQLVSFAERRSLVRRLKDIGAMDSEGNITLSATTSTFQLRRIREHLEKLGVKYKEHTETYIRAVVSDSETSESQHYLHIFARG